MQEVGDEIRIYYFGCPNLFRQWPAQYVFKDYPPGVTPDVMRRGSVFSPSYLGLATLPRDRFAYASGPGSVTTRPRDLTTDGVWLNAEGQGLEVTALDAMGNPAARGTLSDERRQTVYRKVVWSGPAPRARHAIRVTLRMQDRLFSLAT